MSTPNFRSGLLVQLACLVVILAGLKAASNIVIPLLLAIFIATIAYAPINWLVKHKVPLWLAVVLILLAVLVLVLGVGGAVLQSAFELQANQAFYEDRLRHLYANLSSWIATFGINLTEDFDLWSTVFDPSQLWTLGVSTLSGIGSTLSNGFLILLVFIFIVAESSTLPTKLRQVFVDQGYETNWLTSFAKNLNQYIAIKSGFSVVTGVLIAISLWLLGVDFPILWGMLAFMLNYIPNIGSVIAATPAVLLALIQLGIGYACATMAIFIIVNQVIGAAIEPRFLGAKLNLSALIVFLSLILWGWLFGPVGMLLSVPLTMSIKLVTEGHESTAWIAHFLSRESIDNVDQDDHVSV